MIARMLKLVAMDIDSYSTPYQDGRIVSTPKLPSGLGLGELGLAASIGLRALGDLATDFFTVDAGERHPVTDPCNECNPYPGEASRAKAAILLRLREGPASSAALVIDTMTMRTTLFVALTALIRKGFIYNDKSLYWILAAGMDAAAQAPPFVTRSFRECITSWWFDDMAEESVKGLCDITGDCVEDMRSAARLVLPVAVAA